MRRWSLALLVSLASPALAQEPSQPPAAPAAPAAKPPAAPPAASPAKAPAPVTPPASGKAEITQEEETRQEVQEEARFLFQSLLTGDVRNAASELSYPFQLEEKRFGTPEELVQAWVKQVRLKRTDLVTLYDIEVLTLAEMEKKHGKAPARLGLDLRNAKDVWAAVGNLSGHAAIFLFRASGTEQPRAFAYTD